MLYFRKKIYISYNFSDVITKNLTVSHNILDREIPPIPEPTWTFLRYEGGTPTEITNSTFPNVIIISGDNGGLQFTNIMEKQQGLYTATFGSEPGSPTFVVMFGTLQPLPISS